MPLFLACLPWLAFGIDGPPSSDDWSLVAGVGGDVGAFDFVFFSFSTTSFGTFFTRRMLLYITATCGFLAASFDTSSYKLWTCGRALIGPSEFAMFVYIHNPVHERFGWITAILLE